MWDRLDSTDNPSQQYARVRAAMLDAEQARLLQVRDSGDADQHLLGRVMNALDVEESILDRINDDGPRPTGNLDADSS